MRLIILRLKIIFILFLVNVVCFFHCRFIFFFRLKSFQEKFLSFLTLFLLGFSQDDLNIFCDELYILENKEEKNKQKKIR